MWKYTTCFKPLHIFLASELSKNLHVYIFASVFMKSSRLLHEAVRGPFSICKHILSIFRGWKRLFSKHIEAEEKINHADKKRVYAKKKIEAWFVSLISRAFFKQNSQLFRRQFKLVTWTAKYDFFTGVAVKIAVSVNWCAAPVFLC